MSRGGYRLKKSVVSIALATTLSFGAVGLQPAIAGAPEPGKELLQNPHERNLIKKIDSERIYQTIDHLQQTPRGAGTESEANAIRYVKRQFESYGYDVTLQPFTFIGYTAPTAIELSGVQGEWNPDAFTYSVSGDVSGELVSAGLGRVGDFDGVDVEGKIVLIQRGEITFAQKIVNASEAGAAGVIIYNNTDGSLSGTLGEPDDRYIPAITLSKAEGEELRRHIGETVRLTIEGAETSERTSHNVIASKAPVNKKKATDDVLIIGAHHDSVEGAPGANDDASGTAVTLELAKVFKNVPTDTEIRFITFGAEELGLLGSYHYVDSLPQTERDRIIGYFNLDMVGSRDAGDLVLRTLDGSPNLVTELSQAASERLNGFPTPIGEGGRSDHVPFAEAGIPAGAFIHSPFEPWYHTPEDTIDKISKEKLQDVAEIVGAAVYEQARPDHQGPKPKSASKVKASKDSVHEKNIR